MIGTFTVTDDRMILIVAVAFFVGAVWGWWLRHSDAQIEKHYEDNRTGSRL